MDTHGSASLTYHQLLRRMKCQRFYASNHTAITALELTTVLSTVLSRRFRQDFADEMCAELRRRAEALQADDFTGQCTASIVSEVASWPIWKCAG